MQPQMVQLVRLQPLFDEVDMRIAALGDNQDQ